MCICSREAAQSAQEWPQVWRARDLAAGGRPGQNNGRVGEAATGR